MEYKLIALDLDGTLKNSNNEITLKTKEALLKAQEQGIKIVLASGRPTPGLRHEAEELELEKYGGYILSFNGARVVDVKTKETIYEQTLSIDEAKQAYDRAKEFSLACMTYEDDVIVTEDINDEYVKVEAKINDIEKKKVDFKDNLKDPIHKVLLTGQPDYVASVIDEFKKPFKVEAKINDIEKKKVDFKDNLKDPIHKVLLTGQPDYVASVIDEFKKPFGDSLSIYRSAPFFIEIMARLYVARPENLPRGRTPWSRGARRSRCPVVPASPRSCRDRTTRGT